MNVERRNFVQGADPGKEGVRNHGTESLVLTRLTKSALGT